MSLLLSKHSPAPADSTMSPYLKQNAPTGSLGAEVNGLPKVSDAQQADQEKVSIGWKMQSLNATADSLLKSATRLEEEVERETRYWEQVLAVKEQGWSLCRLPRERYTMGVRYGFAEGMLISFIALDLGLTALKAASEFRDRGLAALRRDEDGNIHFDRGVESINRTLRVRIQQHNKEIISRTQATSRIANEVPVETEILEARNSIFDEELHHELHREARTLASHGVRCIGDTIKIPYEADKQILIDLTSFDDDDLDMPQLDEVTQKLKPDQTPDWIVLCLRLLLTHTHRQTLRRRCQPPPPISEKPPVKPTYILLRPILAHIRHRDALQSTQEFLRKLSQPLSSASLQFTSSTSPTLLPTPPSTARRQPTKSTLTTAFTLPLTTTLTTTLPSKTATLSLEITTPLSTTYTATLTPVIPTTNTPEPISVTSFPSLKPHILHLLSSDLISLIISTPSPHPKIGSWKASDPYKGELTRRNGRTRQIDKLCVQVDETELVATWQGGAVGFDGLRTASWGLEGGQVERGLLEWLEDVGSDVMQ